MKYGNAMLELYRLWSWRYFLRARRIMEAYSMDVFTKFIVAMDSKGFARDGAELQRVWDALRRVLRRELRRRGLWHSSPNLLGLSGWSSWWKEDFSNDENWPVSDALDELVSEAYLQIFVTRLASLKQSLKTKSNIEGLVYRNVSQVIHDAQKRHDPLGYQVFQWLREACESLRHTREVFTLGKGGKIGNGTVFTFDPEGASWPPDRRADPAMADMVKTWNDQLMPEWFVAGGQQTPHLVDALAMKILGLRDAGIEVFGFQQIIEPWKEDLRARWAVVWCDLFADGGRHVDPALPDWVYEGKDRFDKLARLVEQRLLEHPCQKRTRAHLLRLWNFLLLYAWSDVGEELKEGDLMDAVDSDHLPSNRELSRLLSIPRDRFPDLFETLRAVVAKALLELDSMGLPCENTPVGPVWRR